MMTIGYLVFRVHQMCEKTSIICCWMIIVMHVFTCFGKTTTNNNALDPLKMDDLSSYVLPFGFSASELNILLGRTPLHY